MPAADRNRCRSARHSRYFKAARCAWLVALWIAAVAFIPRCIPGSRRKPSAAGFAGAAPTLNSAGASLVPRLTVSNRIM